MLGQRRRVSVSNIRCSLAGSANNFEPLLSTAVLWQNTRICSGHFHLLLQTWKSWPCCGGVARCAPVPPGIAGQSVDRNGACCDPAQKAKATTPHELDASSSELSANAWQREITALRLRCRRLSKQGGCQHRLLAHRARSPGHDNSYGRCNANDR